MGGGGMTGTVWAMTSLLQWVAGTTKTVADPQNAKLQRITNTSPPHFLSALLILAFDQYHGHDDYDDLYFCVTYYGLGTIKGWLISLLFSTKQLNPKRLYYVLKYAGGPSFPRSSNPKHFLTAIM